MTAVDDVPRQGNHLLLQPTGIKTQTTQPNYRKNKHQYKRGANCHCPATTELTATTGLLEHRWFLHGGHQAMAARYWNNVILIPLLKLIFL